MNNPVLILYLEDDPRDAELVRDKLQQLTMPYELRIATGRAQYEAALAQTRFDLILSDYALPDYDGFAALTLALDKQPDVPFIMISGTLSEEQAVDCLHRGATDYVIKQNLKRLVPAFMRALTEAEDRQKRRAAEAALKDEAQRRRVLFEECRDGIVVMDREGKVCDANHRYTEMLGYSHDEVLRLHIWDWNKQWTQEQLLGMIRSTDSVGSFIETRHLRKDGSQYDVEVSSNAVIMAGQTFIFWVCRDVTARKQAEAAQAQMQAQLIQSQKLESIGTLAVGVAHEINNPIMGVMGYAQLIQDKLGPDSPVADYAAEIGKEAERVTLIVKNLLSFSRIDTQISSSARLHDIVETTLSLIRAVLRHDDITLEVDVSPDLPEIRCRPQQIQQVIMNLVTNARDALNEKYPQHNANKIITINAREVAGGGGQGLETASFCPRWLRLTVGDHGPGIPEDLCVRIFEPFFTTKPRGKGTGLGLSITYGIVKDHGGLVSVESEVGQWTRFHVDLPVERENG